MPFKKQLFNNRFAPVFLVAIVSILISFTTRVILLISSANGFDFSFTNLAGVFFLGLLYDVTVAAYLIIPFVLQLWLQNETIYKRKYFWWVCLLFGAIIGVLIFTQLVPKDFNEDLRKVVIYYFIIRFAIYLFLSLKSYEFRVKWRRIVLYVDFFLITFMLLFNAVSEWFFWNEFSNRYNFIAVDYLIYTTEVIGNIRESYPIGWIIVLILTATVIVFLFARKSLCRFPAVQMNFPSRTVLSVILLLISAIAYTGVQEKWRQFSKNEYANELAGNGFFQFGTAFWHNELDFYKFYQTLPDSTAFSILRQELKSPVSTFVNNDVYDITRSITYNGPERKLNVVLISVESLSADYMKEFGSTKNITPSLDSLVNYSILFSNLYASGTRTVRGLEALSLAIPPTPGQSVVKRPDNANLFSLGSVFQAKGYITQYIYGGYGYFDNMNTFFGSNNYEVIDRTALKPPDIHYQNIWGVADEDLFTLSLKTFDNNYRLKKHFFSQIMTVSNHRPFTYPEGRIDIPPEKQVREGAVKYTDYAINKFLKDASGKPWFDSTVFVIVADHCAGSAGSVQLPVTGYHIPMLIYAPKILEAQVVNKLMAQIDIAPTILGILKFRYLTKFFGQDIFTVPPEKERAFISTYQGLGYLKQGRLVIQSPLKNMKEYIPDFSTGDVREIPVSDSLSREAISYYQCASWVIRHKRYSSLH